MQLCSPIDNDLMWSTYGLRIDKRIGFNTRFEVECHNVVASFERNEWLEKEFEVFVRGQTAQPEKRRRLMRFDEEEYTIKTDLPAKSGRC